MKHKSKKMPKAKAGETKMTPDNTNMHKLLKMGKNPKVSVSGGKKTPA